MYVNNRYCDNTIRQNNKDYKLEKIWRESRKDKTVDSKGDLFPYPKEGKYHTPEKQDLINKMHVLQTYLDTKKHHKLYKNPLDCLLCDKKNVTTKKYYRNNIMWEDGLIHYIDAHKIDPSIEFKKFIFDFPIEKITNIHDSRTTSRTSKSLRRANTIQASIITKNNIEYVMIDKNQLLILDALMIHGGYIKKYKDDINNIKRYSEHAGFLDFEDNTLSKIIVSGKTRRIDEDDDDIYLPLGMDEMIEYEYIFHTHPPTPKIGGRVDDNILYEFPSVGDIFHFIDHFNDGKVIGSLIVSAEGLYNIRKNQNNKKKININESKLQKDYEKIFNKTQNDAIKKYGTTFDNNYFYSKIAQDVTAIDNLNKILNEYELHIDFYPRKKDEDNNWIIDTVFLVFH